MNDKNDNQTKYTSGVDFGTPLAFLDQWRDNPHAWVKLWKHEDGFPPNDFFKALDPRLEHKELYHAPIRTRYLPRRRLLP